MGEGVLCLLVSVDGDLLVNVREHSLENIRERGIVTGSGVTPSIQKGRVKMISKETSHSAIH